ncbi:hypothetical protein QBC39DRAFT_26239 [Podospora conica]|nr:hypothetical protein QBC39DRAFT_26239 [Schizothecium conicum]
MPNSSEGPKFDHLTGNFNPPPGGPLIRFFQDAKHDINNPDRGFSGALDHAVVWKNPAGVARALKHLGLRQGFRLFGLPGVDRIDAADEDLQMLRQEGHRKGWAVYIAQVRAAWSDHSLNDPTTVCATLDEDDDEALFRTLMALEELGQCEFQIMSIQDADGSEIIPPYEEYEETPGESRLRFHSLRRFLQPDFFQLHHRDRPTRLEDGTMSEGRTWTRDVSLACLSGLRFFEYYH